MNEINITLPAIDETVIATLQTLNTQASATEIDALKAIREKYAPLARQNGVVRIAWTRCGDGSNWSQERDYYYERNGKRIKALKAYDGFDQPHTSNHTGENTGDRLYLLETGEWLRIERTGHWSQWQGSSQEWSCGAGIIDRGDYSDEPETGGSVALLTDVEVEAEYNLVDVVSELAKSLQTLAEKLPARMSKLQQRVALATKLLEGLSAR